MSTVINLPQGQSLGGSIGNTLGSIIAQQGAATIAAMEAARFQKIQNSIASAPDRNTAIAIATQLPFKNMQEFEHTMKYLDQYHPQSEDATVDFKSYDDRGNEVTTAMSRQQTRLKGPQTKLAQEDVYQLNPTTGRYESYGKNVAHNISSNQTTPGAAALDNMAADNRRADDTTRQAKNNEARLQLSSSIGANKAVQGTLVTALGGFASQDGMSFNFGEDNVARNRFAKMLPEISDALDRFGGDIGKTSDYLLNKNGVPVKPPEPVIPEPVPKESFWKHPIDNTIKALTPTPDANVTTPAPAPALPKAPATADFAKQRAAIKGVPLRVEPNPPEDPHNPTIYYPKSAADMDSIPEGGTYLNLKDGLHYVKTASVAPPVVYSIQTSGVKGDVAPNLKGGKETGQLLGPIDIEKEIKIAPGVLTPDGKIKNMEKAVIEVERLRTLMDRIHKDHPLMPVADYNKVLDAVHSLTNPMHETNTQKSITVGPPVARKPNGDFHMSDISSDGKFYQDGK